MTQPKNHPAFFKLRDAVAIKYQRELGGYDDIEDCVAQVKSCLCMEDLDQTLDALGFDQWEVQEFKLEAAMDLLVSITSMFSWLLSSITEKSRQTPPKHKRRATAK